MLLSDVRAQQHADKVIEWFIDRVEKHRADGQAAAVSIDGVVTAYFPHPTRDAWVKDAALEYLRLPVSAQRQLLFRLIDRAVAGAEAYFAWKYDREHDGDARGQQRFEDMLWLLDRVFHKMRLDLPDLLSVTEQVTRVRPLRWDELELTTDLVARLGRRATEIRSSSASVDIVSRLARHLGSMDGNEWWEEGILTIVRERSSVTLTPGDGWTDLAIADLTVAPEATREGWAALLEAARTVPRKGSPPARWLRTAAAAMKAVGAEEFIRLVPGWFAATDRPRSRPRTWTIHRRPVARRYDLITDSQVLRGLAWLATLVAGQELQRGLAALAVSANARMPGAGPRDILLGNTAIAALGALPGTEAIGQLLRLRWKLKSGPAQKAIAKALNLAAAREGLAAEDIDELGVPDYGLTEVGKRTNMLGEHRVELVVSGAADAEMKFFKPDGKPLKSVPAAIRGAHAEERKELKAAARDAAAMVSAQQGRIDSLFVHNKSWAVPVWRERYLDHPLVGVISRRLIWRMGEGSRAQTVTWLDGVGLVDFEGKPVEVAEDRAVRLWHPIEASAEQVMAWRRFFESRQISQPFKQAHREVYLPTDAEGRTQTYSNRFSGHVIRQHQFNALCGVRGWKHKLRLNVDTEYLPAFKAMAEHGLRAEFWIESLMTERDADFNESGVYHLLTTGQVRFYPIGAAHMTAHASGGGYRRPNAPAHDDRGIRLADIPPLVLSEVLRDVDLFVSVCSVGNNPEWNDGGPGHVHRDYWHHYAFGDLFESGRTRHDVLSRLLPRLKIARACELGDKFLRVRGRLRTYKIHLGSANILMEPNDQYLCIVPTSRDEASGSATGVFLPFEGDRTLSIILSKAFMLAEDDKIKDQTITRQIKGQ